MNQNETTDYRYAIASGVSSFVERKIGCMQFLCIQTETLVVGAVEGRLTVALPSRL